MKAPTIFFLMASLSSQAASGLPQWQITDTNLAEYFRAGSKRISDRCLADIRRAEDWREHAPEYRRQLAEMLGLSPRPANTDLKATTTRRHEADTFTVENLHFQSRPGLYVTANLYLPKGLIKPAPALLYVCGHGPVITNGISYGNKVAYQHHGIWFARNGYVCLVVDTLQLGEIQGLHHGTHHEGMWWWNARGYTPAGVETWNNMRALDYLSTRPEVDTNRFGVTGRSGGGAYSWFLTAMDERIKAAAPVAGITDLENHVVDGCVEGHCDCMFFVNTYRWDYPMLAALAAPRPLLLCNSDSDSIFPLDGVIRLRNKVRGIYDLLGAGDKMGLIITPGPHKDTQELQLPVLRWFNKYLKGEEPLVENAAVKLFTPEQLKVFEKLPADAINTNIHDTFVPAARVAMAKSSNEWTQQAQTWRANLMEKSFGAWPSLSGPADPIRREDRDVPLGKLGALTRYKAVWRDRDTSFFISPIFTQPSPTESSSKHPASFILSLRIAKPGGTVLDASSVNGQLDFYVPDPGASANAAKKTVQIQRRHMLLGETENSVRVWDIIRAVRAVRESEQFGNLSIVIQAEGDLAVDALYASLFVPVSELQLTKLPRSHRHGPDYLNVLRFMDIPQAVAMASERCRVELREVAPADWEYPVDVATRFGWKQNLIIHSVFPP